MPTRADDALLNEAFYEAYLSDDRRLQKQAEDTVNAYTRLKIREDGIVRRVLPPIPIANTDLDRQVDTALPAKVVDMEVNSPAAISVPFANFPTQVYIRGNRYRVLFHRILSPWFQADVEELRTNVMDIRQVLSDNSIKDIAAEEDANFFNAVDTVVGTANAAQAFSGVIQNVSSPASISRNSLWDMWKVMQGTDGSLMPEKAVANPRTMAEICKFGRDEVGGDFSQDLFRNGWSEAKFMNMDWIITIKKNIVPDNTVYLFASEKFMGKFYTMEDTTMFIERRAFFLSYFAYECLGMTLANPYAFVKYAFAA